MSSENPKIEMLLTGLNQAFDRKSWHGTTLRGGLRRVDASMAAWRPQSDRPNIWEIVLHCAYWKQSVLRRVATGPVEPFPIAGSNWFPRPQGELSERVWREDLGILGRIHRSLRTAVAVLDDGDLPRIPERSKTTIEDLVRGVASHDLHHGGQIQLIKRLWSGVRS